MKKTKLSLLLVSLVVVLSVFSMPVLAEIIPAAKPDKGLVIFYRISKMKGKAIRFEISDRSKGSIGNLSNGTIIQKDMEPGEHTFTVRSPSFDGQDSITLNVETGKIFYVKGEILWGWPAGRSKFTLMQSAEAQADLAKIK